MTKPRYQEIPSAKIPEATSEDGLVKVRVIAGESLGKRAVIETHTPILYLHFTVQPGGQIRQPAPEEYNTFAYVIAGEGNFGPDGEKATRGQMVMFASDGDGIAIENTGERPLDLLVIGGVPLHEPIARYGPFVMNTREEIYQAFEDFRSGRMGEIAF